LVVYVANCSLFYLGIFEISFNTGITPIFTKHLSSLREKKYVSYCMERFTLYLSFSLYTHEVFFHCNCLLITSYPVEGIIIWCCFYCGHLPVRLSSSEVIFQWGHLPVRSSSSEVILQWGLVPVRSSYN
jgi:hypothetical protein